MRQKLIYCFMLICSLSIFTSCKDDDKNEPPVNFSESIIGTYKGDIAIQFSEIDMRDTIVQKIYISSVGPQVVKLELKDFNYNSLPIGNITIESVTLAPIANSSNAYTLSGEQDVVIPVGTVHVVLTGKVENNAADLIITIKNVVAVGDITVHFTGNKMAEDNESTEAKITSFTTSSSSSFVASHIDEENAEITLFYSSLSSTMKLTPEISISEGATITPSADVVQDFRQELKYTVLAQDSIHSREYTIKSEKHAKINIESVTLQESDALFGIPYLRENTIIIFVNDKNNMTYTPVFTLPSGVSISPASGTAQDFSKGDIIYTVTADDNAKVTKQYTVSVRENTNKFSFNDWVVENIVKSKEQKKPLGGWSSTNTAVALLMTMNYATDFSTVPSADAKAGAYAASLQTLDTKGGSVFGISIPKVTAGSMFLGNFNTEHAMGNQLLCTEFGVPFYQKPTHFKGSYKYTPGTTYHRCDDPSKSNVTVIDNSKTDAPAINAILYEVNDYSETLTGEDILTSPKIIAIAQAADNDSHSAYKDFNITFNYLQSYDASKKYKLAIVCSSSKDGDKFSGAPGSTLIVDEFEIVTE